MSSLIENINTCIETRKLAADIVAQTLTNANGYSELDLQRKLLKTMSSHHAIYPVGWYSPPPKGIGVLFADSKDVKRSQFPTLRTEPYWPSPDYTMNNETVGMTYLSPVHKASGIIGDLGLTFYRGADTRIQEHLARCLSTVEEIAEQAVVGMTLRDLHDKGQEILTAHDLHNGWMVTYNDPLHGPNFGHTMPWTYETPTAIEQAVIEGGDITELQEVISKKRLFVNSIETFVIPDSIAFGVEARMGVEADPTLPGGYYYALITFQAGKRKIFTFYNAIFDALDITYMRSRF